MSDDKLMKFKCFCLYKW